MNVTHSRRVALSILLQHTHTYKPQTRTPTQYLAVDGRRVLALDIPKTGLEDNFTRAYYTCSGRVILSGKCVSFFWVCVVVGRW